MARLIEFDGEQHFSDYTKGNWGKICFESLEKIKQRDQEKNQWAKDNHIPLVRIPYWERYTITLDKIMGNDYLVI